MHLVLFLIYVTFYIISARLNALFQLTYRCINFEDKNQWFLKVKLTHCVTTYFWWREGIEIQQIHNGTGSNRVPINSDLLYPPDKELIIYICIIVGAFYIVHNFHFNTKIYHYHMPVMSVLPCVYIFMEKHFLPISLFPLCVASIFSQYTKVVSASQ